MVSEQIWTVTQTGSVFVDDELVTVIARHSNGANGKVAVVPPSIEAIRKLPEEKLDAAVFAVLAAALAAGDENFRKQALDALKVKRVARNAPAGLVKAVCELAQHPKETIRRRAVLALGETAEADLALGALIRAVGDARHGVRKNAIASLGKLGDARAVESLIRALEDANEDVRRRAAKELGQLGDTFVVEPLVAALQDRDDIVRQTAAEALGHVGDARAVEPLIATLKDYYQEVRWAAAVALGKLGDRRAVKPLTAVLRGGDAGTQERAAEALRRLGAVSMAPLDVVIEDGDTQVWRAVFETPAQPGNLRAVQPLVASHILAAIRTGDADVRLGATRALGGIWRWPELTQLGDTDWRLRSEASTTLGQLGDARAVEPLIAALEDENAYVRRAAVKALGKLGDARAVDSLIFALSDSDALVRSAAAEILGALRDVRGVGPLIDAFNDGDLSVRRAAADALKEVGELALEPLIAALQGRRGAVQRRAAQVLADLADRRTVGPFITALKKGDGVVKWEAARALRRIGTKDALTALEGYQSEMEQRGRVKKLISSMAFLR